MTHYCGFTVVFEKEMTLEAMDKILEHIRLYKGIVEITTLKSDIYYQVALVQARHQIIRKLLDVLDSE